MTHTAFQVDNYDVSIGNLRELDVFKPIRSAYNHIFILTDENVHPLHFDYFTSALALENPPHTCVIPVGEVFKSLDTCQQIWQRMFEANLDRKSLVINFGGGVIGDMGGFCAATYKRGIDFIQVPTTLLAATDASVGGKLGIDFHGFKNSIGVFCNPQAVWIDPVFFQTLPERELRSGFAEVIKHALIGDDTLWSQIKTLRDLKDIEWTQTLAASIAVKVSVVQQDPLEKGLRAVLNYGHTIGHAIESYFLETSNPLTHGESVAIGMLMETWIAAQHGQSRIATLLPDLSDLFRQLYTYREIPAIATPELWRLMQQDKKNHAGEVRMGVPGDTLNTLSTLALKQEEVTAALAWWESVRY